MLIVMHHMSKAFNNQIVLSPGAWWKTVSKEFLLHIIGMSFGYEVNLIILSLLLSFPFFPSLFFFCSYFPHTLWVHWRKFGSSYLGSCENVSTQPYQCDLVHMHCNGEHLLILPRLPGNPTPWFSTACVYTCSHNHTGPTCSSSSSQELSILSDVFTRLVDNDWLMITYIAPSSALLSRLTAHACGSTWVTSFL